MKYETILNLNKMEKYERKKPDGIRRKQSKMMDIINIRLHVSGLNIPTKSNRWIKSKTQLYPVYRKYILYIKENICYANTNYKKIEWLC